MTMTMTREEVMARMAQITGPVVGVPQHCAFCGLEYQMAEGEEYRPRAVCAECWPDVSDIESRAGEIAAPANCAPLTTDN